MWPFQAADKKSWRIPFSNVYTQTKHSMKYYHHWGTTLFMIWIHGMCLLGPATYSPVLAMVTVPIIILFGLGIEMVFHRMLCHKAFSSPKWWEYTMAYFGILNIQVRYLLRNLEGPESCCLQLHEEDHCHALQSNRSVFMQKLRNLPLSPCICHTGAAEPIHHACVPCTTCCKCDLNHIVPFLTQFAFRVTLSSGYPITGITTNTQILPWTPTPLMTGTSGLTLAGCGTMRYAHSQLCHSHMSPSDVLCA